MDYRVLWKDENEAVKERYYLAMERIGQITRESTVEEPYRSYFIKTAEFIQMISEVKSLVDADAWNNQSLEELKLWNERLYEDVLPSHYETSYANPSYAVRQLGVEFGSKLSFLYEEIRGQIPFAMESRLTEMTILDELFIEIYNLFEGQLPQASSVQETLYWFTSDYADLTVTYQIRENFDPSLSFAKDIILERDLNDLRYLYAFGEYISDEELKIAGFMNRLPQETIDKMADTYT